MTHTGKLRMAREKKTIETMVGMYCLAQHKTGVDICKECAGILEYARLRLDKCPFGEEKLSCAKCTVHCYSPDMRAKIIAIMRYTGPRMILKHPVIALRHKTD